MTTQYEHELKTALAAVQQAMTVCRAVQSTITPGVLEKKDRSPVTIADFASQSIICRALEAALPSDAVIGEEDATALRTAENADFLKRVVDELQAVEIEASNETVCSWIDRGNANQYSDRFWTLDPIDGTKGFLRGGQYAISLALIVEGRIDVAILGCPNLPTQAGGATPGSLFHAVRGGGSFVQSEGDNADVLPVRVSGTSDTTAAKLCESVESGHSAHGRSAQVAERLGIAASPVRLDSQAKYATVARGEADIYLRLPTRVNYVERIWDHAGGVLLVEEAGGQVSDVTGKPLEWTHGAGLDANSGVVVTNGRLHSTVLEALAAT
jgi:3'(2'), 5'-bisphosphate nucleotidase